MHLRFFKSTISHKFQEAADSGKACHDLCEDREDVPIHRWILPSRKEPVNQERVATVRVFLTVGPSPTHNAAVDWENELAVAAAYDCLDRDFQREYGLAHSERRPVRVK
jgi:hypothetical protein